MSGAVLVALDGVGVLPIMCGVFVACRGCGGVLVALYGVGVLSGVGSALRVALLMWCRSSGGAVWWCRSLGVWFVLDGARVAVGIVMGAGWLLGVGSALRVALLMWCRSLGLWWCPGRSLWCWGIADHVRGVRSLSGSWLPSRGVVVSGLSGGVVAVSGDQSDGKRSNLLIISG